MRTSIVRRRTRRRPPPERPSGLTAGELDPERWPDFERLFRKYRGVQAGCWCMFYHRGGPNGPLASAARREANRRDHRALVEQGAAHGVVVYRDGRPIGWCQFGPRSELPRVERGRKYRALAPGLGSFPDWRITCFFVDRPARREGVAEFALGAALAAIARRGGGCVEAYPTTHPRAVAAWFGTVGMFERAGFADVRPFGASQRLMRRVVRPADVAGRAGRGPRR